MLEPEGGFRLTRLLGRQLYLQQLLEDFFKRQRIQADELALGMGY